MSSALSAILVKMLRTRNPTYGGNTVLSKVFCRRTGVLFMRQELIEYLLPLPLRLIERRYHAIDLFAFAHRIHSPIWGNGTKSGFRETTMLHLLSKNLLCGCILQTRFTEKKKRCG